MSSIIEWMQNAYYWIWGTPMLIAVLGSSLWFTIASGGFQFRHFTHFFKETFGKMLSKDTRSVSKDGKGGHISILDVASTAVGGAVGVGNISGVATAVATGGPGALFWMWIEAWFAMALKCAEVTLGVFYRKTDEKGDPYGGPCYYISRGLPQVFGEKFKKAAAVIGGIWGFCFMCNFLSGVQGYTICEGFAPAWNLDILACGVVLSVVIWILVWGGTKRVAKVAGYLVPIMCVLFILGAILIVLTNISSFGSAIALIVRSAFTPTAAVGGFTGVVVKTAITQGISRAVFSNEAGQGSSTMIHSQANVDHPFKQGMWGYFEVFVDTILVCFFTGLAIVISGAWSSGAQGATLTISAFSTTFGPWAGKVVSVFVLLFGLTTITGWFTYYDNILRFMCGKNVKLKNAIVTGFRVVFPIPMLLTIWFTVNYGASTSFVWTITDLLCSVPACLNIICVVLMSGTFIKLVKDYKARYLGIGQIDPDFRYFYDQEEYERAEAARKAAGK